MHDPFPDPVSVSSVSGREQDVSPDLQREEVGVRRRRERVLAARANPLPNGDPVGEDGGMDDRVRGPAPPGNVFVRDALPKRRYVLLGENGGARGVRTYHGVGNNVARQQHASHDAAGFGPAWTVGALGPSGRHMMIPGGREPPPHVHRATSPAASSGSESGVMYNPRPTLERQRVREPPPNAGAGAQHFQQEFLYVASMYPPADGYSLPPATFDSSSSGRWHNSARDAPHSSRNVGVGATLRDEWRSTASTSYEEQISWRGSLPSVKLGFVPAEPPRRKPAAPEPLRGDDFGDVVGGVPVRVSRSREGSRSRIENRQPGQSTFSCQKGFLDLQIPKVLRKKKKSSDLPEEAAGGSGGGVALVDTSDLLPPPWITPGARLRGGRLRGGCEEAEAGCEAGCEEAESGRQVKLLGGEDLPSQHQVRLAPRKKDSAFAAWNFQRPQV